MKDLLKKTGEALYGRSWKAQIADLLNVDRRRVSHWLDGDRPIPQGIWEELYIHAQKRADEIDNILPLIEKIK